MNTSPKVLHVVYSLIRGGTEGQCARVAMKLSEDGHPQHVAVFRRTGYFLEPVGKPCGPVYHFDMQRLLSLNTFRQIRNLKQYLMEQQIDLVHAWDADANIFAAWAAMWAGLPYITSHRDMGEIYPEYKLWLMRKSSKKAAAVVVNAEAIKQWAYQQDISPDKVIRVGNILDLEEFDDLASKPLAIKGVWPTGSSLVVHVARLDKEKDTGLLLKAAVQVLALKPETHFLIVGDGAERLSLEKQAEALNLDNHVHFLGDRTDVPALLTGAHVGVLVPKSNEGLSNTLLEYMAARLPVVTTDCGGNRELVLHEETGYVIKIGDAQALAQSLVQLLDDREKAQAMGQAGRSRVAESFTPAGITQTYLELYRSVWAKETR